MHKAVFWGVHRERSHAPGREHDDEAILLAVADRLKRCEDIAVRVLYPREITRSLTDLPDLVFYMCEEKEILDLFCLWQSHGVAFINRPVSVKNTFRQNMLGILSGEPFFPESRFIPSYQESFNGLEQVWIKRGDYHAITKEDVVFAGSKEDVTRTVQRFNRRGISSVLIQDHVAGDLVKFYGVRDHLSGRSRWFHWFYHKEQDLRRYAFRHERLKELCETGASLLELEIYGGDAVVTPTGAIYLIDFNAWPSFALFRDTASEHIAQHIADGIRNCCTSKLPCQAVTGMRG